MDYKAACIYIACCQSRDKVKKARLERIVPERKYNRGRCPGVTTKELWTRKKQEYKIEWDRIKEKAASFVEPEKEDCFNNGGESSVTLPNGNKCLQ